MKPQSLSKRQKIRLELIQMLKDVYDSRESFPVFLNKKDKNLVVRCKVFEDDSQPDIMIIEQEAMGITPKQFMWTFKTVTETQVKWNSLIKSCDKLTEEDGIDLIVTIVKSPVMFVSGRILIDGLYTYEDPVKNEYIAAFSSK